MLSFWKTLSGPLPPVITHVCSSPARLLNFLNYLPVLLVSIFSPLILPSMQAWVESFFSTENVLLEVTKSLHEAKSNIYLPHLTCPLSCQLFETLSSLGPWHLLSWFSPFLIRCSFSCCSWSFHVSLPFISACPSFWSWDPFSSPYPKCYELPSFLSSFLISNSPESSADHPPKILENFLLCSISTVNLGRSHENLSTEQLM